MRSTSGARGDEKSSGDGGRGGGRGDEERGGGTRGGRGVRGDRDPDATEYLETKSAASTRGYYHDEEDNHLRPSMEYRSHADYTVRPHPRSHRAHDDVSSPPHPPPPPPLPRTQADWYYDAGPVRPRYHRPAMALYGRPHSESLALPRHASTLETLLRGGPPGGGKPRRGGERREGERSDEGRVGENRGAGDEERESAMATASSASGSHNRSAPPSGDASGRAKPTRGRTTPYLTESDRQDIMDRIRRGEKQADLAKEYNVSRAAITNLKQRRQMLEMLENSSNLKDREEAQKRRRLSHGNSGPPSGAGGAGAPGGAGLGGASLKATREVVGGGSIGGDGGLIASPLCSAPPSARSWRYSPAEGDSDGTQSNASYTEATEESGAAATTAAIGGTAFSWSTPEAQLPACHREISAYTTSRLLATLLDPHTPDDLFRTAVARHMRLLLEETIGWSYSQMPDRYEPFALAFGSEESTVLLEEYIHMEPATPSAALRDVQQHESGAELELVVRVPSLARKKSPVVVFLDDIVQHPEAEPLAIASASSSSDGGGPRDGRGLGLDGGGDAGGDHPPSCAAGVSSPPPLPPPPPPRSRETTRQCLFLLNSLVFCGVPEHKIVVVVSMCVESVAREIGQRFPDVHIVTTRFLSDRAPAQERALLVAYRVRRRALLHQRTTTRV